MRDNDKGHRFRRGKVKYMNEIRAFSLAMALFTGLLAVGMMVAGGEYNKSTIIIMSGISSVNLFFGLRG